MQVHQVAAISTCVCVQGCDIYSLIYLGSGYVQKIKYSCSTNTKTKKKNKQRKQDWTKLAISNNKFGWKYYQYKLYLSFSKLKFFKDKDNIIKIIFNITIFDSVTLLWQQDFQAPRCLGPKLIRCLGPKDVQAPILRCLGTSIHFSLKVITLFLFLNKFSRNTLYI